MTINCLEYGITPNNDSVHTGIEKETGTLRFVARTGERACIMIWGLSPAVPPVVVGKAPTLCISLVTHYFSFHLKFQGIARTQSPTTTNYALDLPTFGVIAGVNPTKVQWKGLALGDRPY